MLKDSDLGKWEYKEHTRVKHILLEKYLTAWIPILGKWNQKILYFDGFAGRGEYVDGPIGSPVIVLKVADRFGQRYNELVCTFIEKDIANFANLKSVIEREQSRLSNRAKIKIKLFNNEFTDAVEYVLETVKQNKSILAPSFFFVDPFGFSGISFEIIKKILSNPKTEVFFTFMVRDMSRFLDLDSNQETFSELFGTDEWKNIKHSSKNIEYDLVNLYREQLHSKANVKFSWPFRVCSPGKVQTVYYLLHVSNNLKGHMIMKSVMFHQNDEGNFAYMGPIDSSMTKQNNLFDASDIWDVKGFLLDRFLNKIISFEMLLEELSIDWKNEPPFMESHIRDALKDLVKENKISINRITSKKTGISGNDEINFI
ncbi:MAG: three-Cys-motif partner protein TcmP [Candidatus Anammoxibacter sp.]